MIPDSVSSFYLGLDGGGSMLRAMLADCTLKPIRQIRHPRSVNLATLGYDEVRARLFAALDDVLQSQEVAQVRACCVGLAGAEQHLDWLRAVLGERLPNVPVVAVNDGEIALVGAHGRREGALILAGTGSIGYAITPQGDSYFVGGWGYLLDDEGSGFWLGKQALRLLARCADEGRLDVRTERIMQTMGIQAARQLISWAYDEHPFTARKIASLAVLVLELAQAGDQWATQVVEAAAQSLLKMADNLATRWPGQAMPIALVGGLLEHDTLLRQRLLELLHQRDYTIREAPLHSPLEGAVWLARHLYPCK